jgi:uncharacterized membrane protein
MPASINSSDTIVNKNWKITILIILLCLGGIGLGLYFFNKKNEKYNNLN